MIRTLRSRGCAICGKTHSRGLYKRSSGVEPSNFIDGQVENTVTKSRLRAKLQAGEFVRVVGINRVTDPWLTEVAGQLGFDVVWFDMEHLINSRSHAVPPA